MFQTFTDTAHIMMQRIFHDIALFQACHPMQHEACHVLPKSGGEYSISISCPLTQYNVRSRQRRSQKLLSASTKVTTIIVIKSKNTHVFRRQLCFVLLHLCLCIMDNAFSIIHRFNCFLQVKKSTSHDRRTQHHVLLTQTANCQLRSVFVR
jgi:hypothetical protein